MAKAQEFELKPWPPDAGKSGRLIRTRAQGGAAGLIRTPRCGAYIESSRFRPVSIRRCPKLKQAVAQFDLEKGS
jgi:hypothetical protein